MVACFLSILLTLNWSSGDFRAVEGKISRLKTYSSLVDLVKQDIGYPDREGNKVLFEIERELGNNTQQIRLGFTTHEFGEYFHLSLVKRGDKMMYCDLSQGNQYSKMVIDQQEIVQYLDFFNSIFETSKKLTDFKNEIDGVGMFSTGCGFSGEAPKEWERLEKYIEKESKSQISVFLSSLNVESQTYGLIGILELKRKGVELSGADEKIIDFLKERNSQVYTCMGCLVGEIVRTRDLIKYLEN